MYVIVADCVEYGLDSAGGELVVVEGDGSAE